VLGASAVPAEDCGVPLHHVGAVEHV
jgi:hypothetical protein